MQPINTVDSPHFAWTERLSIGLPFISVVWKSRLNRPSLRDYQWREKKQEVIQMSNYLGMLIMELYRQWTSTFSPMWHECSITCLEQQGCTASYKLHLTGIWLLFSWIKSLSWPKSRSDPGSTRNLWGMLRHRSYRKGIHVFQQLTS